MYIPTELKEKIRKTGLPYGKININNRIFFYKIVSKKFSKLEKSGHKKLSILYPIAKLLGSYKINNNQTVLIFEYEKTIGKEMGLLVDLFAIETSVDKKFTKIIDLYEKIFNQTLRSDNGKSCNVFFRDRVKTRLTRYYDKQFISEIDGTKLLINGYDVNIQLGKIIKSIKKFFNGKTKTWCVLSQCDPNDLNIGTKPIILDYVAGGWNPLMAEFATFYWYQLAQGNYLSLKYNSKAFMDHQKIYKRMDKVEYNKNKLVHITSKLRKTFTKQYIEKVILPVIKSITNFDNWYKEFKNYLSMKILCVFDVTKMSKKDMLLSLGYLQLFYDQKINKIENLIDFFEDKSEK